MNLTDEQKEHGRRNFLKALAGTPALAALGVTAVTNGPVKAAVIGTGGMGRGLIGQWQKELIDLRAICDINPKRRRTVAEMMQKTAGRNRKNMTIGSRCCKWKTSRPSSSPGRCGRTPIFPLAVWTRAAKK